MQACVNKSEQIGEPDSAYLQNHGGISWVGAIGGEGVRMSIEEPLAYVRGESDEGSKRSILSLKERHLLTRGF